eukprot:TRINITY_DN514_c0_g3_i1.p1 TRINITY_DN514_c0_g3~~TRINITY_DN514_c0_g3_i1.p1  ORF type:complete len:184 (-),score=6.04 TRINITY_DN514_c0_g3_i1:343-894(-)
MSSANPSVANKDMPPINSIEGFLNQIKTHNFKLAPRPIDLFVHPRNFSKPDSVNQAKERIERNLLYFFSNYCIACLLIIAYSLLLRPWLILILAGLVFVWKFSLDHDVIPLGNVYELKGQTKLIVLSVVTFLLVFFFAGPVLFMVVGICVCVVVAHALFHGSLALNMEKDLENARSSSGESPV